MQWRDKLKWEFMQNCLSLEVCSKWCQRWALLVHQSPKNLEPIKMGLGRKRECLFIADVNLDFAHSGKAHWSILSVVHFQVFRYHFHCQLPLDGLFLVWGFTTLVYLFSGEIWEWFMLLRFVHLWLLGTQWALQWDRVQEEPKPPGSCLLAT